MEAFVMRLAQFSGSDADMEGLASMVANKPVHGWVDSDIDRTTVELAEMAQRFLRVESYAHVKGRQDKRHSMAVTVGMGGHPSTVQKEFDVSSLERPDVEALISRIGETLQSSGEERHNVVLAALAELSARYLDASELDGTADTTTSDYKVSADGQ